MKGTIKIYFEDKQFGFITNEENEDVFFHKSKIISNNNKSIKKNMILSFDCIETKKGLTAENINIDDYIINVQNKYTLPDTVYISKDEHIDRWKTIFKSDYIIHMTDKGNPNTIKQNMMNVAREIGANCILELTYYTEEGSEPGRGSGTHYFTVHHYYGKFAFIAKESYNGNSIDIDEINQIDDTLLSNGDNIQKKYSASSFFRIVLFIGFIGSILYLNMGVIIGDKEFSWFNLILPVFLFLTLYGSLNRHTRCWIETS